MADEEQKPEETKPTAGEKIAAQVREKRRHESRVVHYRIGWMTGSQGTPPGDVGPTAASAPEHAKTAYNLGRAHGFAMYEEVMLRFTSMTPAMIEEDYAALPEEQKARG